MKVLTVRQPWLGLILAGVKTHEYRGWATAHRGPLLLHCSRTPAAADHVRMVAAWCGVDPLAVVEWCGRLPRGHIVGRCDLVGCAESPAHLRKWGRWAWRLANADLVEPVWACGQCGLWEWQR